MCGGSLASNKVVGLFFRVIGTRYNEGDENAMVGDPEHRFIRCFGFPTCNHRFTHCLPTYLRQANKMGNKWHKRLYDHTLPLRVCWG